MTNHVHLVLIPEREDSLAKSLGRVHNDYSRWIHIRRGQIGHLWQNRFYSCPLERAHLWNVVRYVEVNPVRAGLVDTAEEWPWSSAEAHAYGRDRWGIIDSGSFAKEFTSAQWKTVLGRGDDVQLAQDLRLATTTGRPFGSGSFTEHLERVAGRPLARGKPGRKKNPSAGAAFCAAAQMNFEIA